MMHSITFTTDPSRIAQVMPRRTVSGNWRAWTSVVHAEWEGQRLGFYVTADSPVTDQSRESPALWTRRLVKAAAAAAKRETLSAFQENDLTQYLRTTIRPPPMTVIGKVNTAYLQRLASDYKVDQLARRCFQHAVERVLSYASSLPKGDASDGQLMLDFLSRSLDAANLGVMYGWYHEKLAGIRDYLRVLERRQNQNHPGTQPALEYIQSNLRCFSPPDAWRERPPFIIFNAD